MGAAPSPSCRPPAGQAGLGWVGQHVKGVCTADHRGTGLNKVKAKSVTSRAKCERCPAGEPCLVGGWQAIPAPLLKQPCIGSCRRQRRVPLQLLPPVQECVALCHSSSRSSAGSVGRMLQHSRMAHGLRHALKDMQSDARPWLLACPSRQAPMTADDNCPTHPAPPPPPARTTSPAMLRRCSTSCTISQ